jgi:molybdate transport system substrate-binding protein
MKSKKHIIYALAVFMTVISIIGMDTLTGEMAWAESELIVFAAASTTNAITEIGEVYAQKKSVRINPSFASSSTLAKQVENGAPADVFISANVKWMDYLEEKRLLSPGSRYDLLSNRIVLITPVDSPIQEIEVVQRFSLASYLGQDGRLAMGDPKHVPAGMYGQKALSNLNAWDGIKDRVVPMKDVRAALTLVERGETPLGQVYATDAAISKKVRIVGTFPVESHPPIVYPAAVLLSGKKSLANQFMDFLRSEDAREIFKKYGFDL